jgi:hypothetical protein
MRSVIASSWKPGKTAIMSNEIASSWKPGKAAVNEVTRLLRHGKPGKAAVNEERDCFVMEA